LLSHPRTTSLVFHSLDLLHGVLTIPLQLLFGHPRGLILGTNAVLLSCYWLSALSAYACAWSETRDRIASLAAGAGYGFCAFHVSWFSMPVVSAMYWVPLYVLALRRALVEPGIRWTVASGLCALLCTFQSLYFTALLGLVTVVVVGFDLAKSRFARRGLSRALKIVAVLGLAVSPMAAITLVDLGRTVYVAPNMFFYTSDDTASLQSVDLAGLVIPSAKQGWWRFVPGVDTWNGYLKERWDAGGLFGNARGGSIAYVGVATLILAAIGSGRRPPGSALLWLLLAAVSLGIALGPYFHLHGAISRSPWLPMPYHLLSSAVPESLARMFRSPFTFMAVTVFALWMLAARGIARLRTRLAPGTPRRLATAALAVWLVGEHAYAPPEAYPVGLSPGLQRIAQDERAVSVLEIPTDDPFALEVYSLRQALHQKPIARGYLARRSAAISERDRQLNAIGSGPAALESVLSEMRPVYVVVHPMIMRSAEERKQAALVEAVLGAHKIYEGFDEIVYAPDSIGGG
jgi:hypothetical protein